jgi:hypothetical protein
VDGKGCLSFTELNMHLLAVDFYQCIIPDLLLQQALGVFQKKEDPNFSVNVRTMLKMIVFIPLTML